MNEDQLRKLWYQNLSLEARVAKLEEENVETTNALYELENRLQAQLDALITYTMFEPNDVF